MTITTGYVEVKAADGGVFQAYLSKPAAADANTAPGLLLIPEVFGVNSHIRSVADDYASQGFTVLAPDVFWRAEPNVELGYDMDSAIRGMGMWKQITSEQIVTDLQASIKTLQTLCNGSIAAVGYCMGGQMAYRLAATGTIKAAVCYYGGGIGGVLDQAQRISVPVLFHYGALDKSIPQAEVDAVRAAFADHQNVTINVYDDADHGFNCSQRASYNPDAARLARERSLSFLRSVL
jgi:carboxymethylenebutenolidase